MLIHTKLYTGIKKGLTPLESSLFVLKLGIFCHVLLGIWWRELNLKSKTLFNIDYLIYQKSCDTYCDTNQILYP